ncbi:MAG: copper resistance protein CopC [Gammaproteobacteria bacterium]|nr:copper resistance protein CopC [Gammaproteobacteria bacterium]MBL4729755.1 copper resistance protein CopC [Gammaproteobacteria bacterium]MBL4891225.1 copper resistance protein CopC [Rhizobiaceae bacterium]
MNRSTMIKIVSVLGLMLSVPVQSLAHVALVSSMPENGSIVNVAPGSIMLEFTEEVRLLKATVSVKGDEAMDIGFKPVAKAEKHFMVALPSLIQGDYLVNWTVMGSDGHRMEESFSFTFDPTASTTMAHSAEHGAAHSAAGGDSHGDHGGGDH